MPTRWNTGVAQPLETGLFECIACCMEREEREREGPEFPVYVGWDGREHAEY